MRSYRSSVALLLSLTCAGLLAAACGSGGGGSASGAAGNAAATGGCKPGAAASGTSATIPQEADAAVNKPAGKCWGSIKPTAYSNAVIGTAPSGTASAWKAAWSAKYLYIWDQVKLGRAPICTTPANSWNDDTVEIYVSAGNDRSGQFPTGTGQFLVNACGENNAGAAGPQLGGDHTQVTLSPASTGVESATKTGYTIVMELAWKDLGVAPKAGTVVGFSIGTDFATPSSPGTRLAQTMWQGTQNNWDDDTTWGTLKLG